MRWKNKMIKPPPPSKKKTFLSKWIVYSVMIEVYLILLIKCLQSVFGLLQAMYFYPVKKYINATFNGVDTNHLQVHPSDLKKSKRCSLWNCSLSSWRFASACLKQVSITWTLWDLKWLIKLYCIFLLLLAVVDELVLFAVVYTDCTESGQNLCLCEVS